MVCFIHVKYLYYMYLASVFFLLNLKLEIRVACREFLAFKYVVIVFFETKQMII